MRQQHTLEYISGIQESPTGGTTLRSSWNFTTVGAQAGDVIQNKTQGTAGTIQSVTDANNLVANITFRPGDLFEITLSTAWSAASNIGPTYELVCKVCGFACTTEELDSHDGKCKECYDPPHPSSAKTE